MLQASRYQQVYISDWQVQTCAGRNHDAYKACAQQQSHLSLHQLGWIGQIADQAADLLKLARTEAAALWQRRSPTLQSEIPICCLSSSKGQLNHLAQNECTIAEAWPSALAAHICQEIGISTYIGMSCAAACSTGLYTVLDAADLLEAEQADHALCGAADAALDPLLLGAYKNLGVMAQDPPQAFCESSTGFAPAEGASFFLLAHQGPWQLRAGVRAGDASHITRCEDAGLFTQCLEALWDAVPQPDVIVTHATGTEFGDQFERQALEHGPWSTVQLLHCKPSIGHCLGASGSVELAIGLHAPVQRLWKISLGFGGHIAAVALTRS